MADMADNLVTLIDEKWSGPAKPDIIEKVLERPDWGKFGKIDRVIIMPLGSGRHIHVTRDYYNVVYGFEIVCYTMTSSDRLKELYEEVIDIIYNWYLTGVDKQRVMDQQDLSDKTSGKFKYTIHIELEALMVYKGGAVQSGIPAGYPGGPYLPLSGGTMSGNIDMDSSEVQNAGAISVGTDVANDLIEVKGAGNIGIRIDCDTGGYGAVRFYENGVSKGAFYYHSELFVFGFNDSLPTRIACSEYRPNSNNHSDLGSNSYAWKDVYAYSYVDKSKAFDEIKAREIIDSFAKLVDKEEIDHTKLHPSVLVESDEIVYNEETGEYEKTGKKVYGRDIGSCVSALMTVVKEQQKQIDDLIKQVEAKK